MDKNQDNSGPSAEKPATRRKDRVRFRTVPAPKPNIFLPDLSRRKSHASWGSDGGRLTIWSEDGIRREETINIPNDRAISLEIDEQAIAELANKFDIEDRILLRIALVLAAERTKTNNKAYYGPFLSLITDENSDKLRRADKV